MSSLFRIIPGIKANSVHSANAKRNPKKLRECPM